MQHSRTWVLAIYMSCYFEEIARDHEPHIITNIPLLMGKTLHIYTHDASRCLAILSINTSSSDEKIDLWWFGECSPKHRRYSLMFAEHSVTIADCSLKWSVIHRRYFCDALVNISEALAMHPEASVEMGGGRTEGGGEGGRKGGVDLYKFLSSFMSVIVLYYFTCMFLSRVYVHFYCSPVVVLIYYIGDLALLRPTRFFDWFMF